MPIHVRLEFVIWLGATEPLHDRANDKGNVSLSSPHQENIVNKIVLALATVATLGLSTAAFAQSSAVSTQKHVQHVQMLRASHRTGVKKVAVATRHGKMHHVMLHPQHFSHAKTKKVTGKHVAAHKTAKTKASS
jgi:hypothetical protein